MTGRSERPRWRDSGAGSPGKARSPASAGPSRARRARPDRASDTITRPPDGAGPLQARSRVLLKARPTGAQLTDRLAPPVPDGMELYMHEQDLAGDSWFEPLAARFRQLALPPD